MFVDERLQQIRRIGSQGAGRDQVLAQRLVLLEHPPIHSGDQFLR